MDATEVAVKYDLTRTHTKHLDVHLVFPILEFIQQRGLYDNKEVVNSKLELLEKTNMVDFKGDEYKKLHGKYPDNLEEDKKKILQRLTELSAEVQPILDAMQDVTAQNEAADAQEPQGPHIELTAAMLEAQYQISGDKIESLYHFANYLFSIAKYEDAGDYLLHYSALAVNNKGRQLNALWGHFCIEILNQQWQGALEDMSRLREVIENPSYFAEPLMQYQQRAWLLHWSLFVFFNYPDGFEAVIDLFMDLFLNDKYLNTIQTVCPHLLRYVATAMIVGKRSRKEMKLLIRIISQEQYEYKDPITEFVYQLFVKFDFQAAGRQLEQCEAVISNDFFLVRNLESFRDRARVYMIEMYCRLHHTLEVSQLSTQLGLELSVANQWVEGLIAQNELNALLEDGLVKMQVVKQNVNDKILDQTNQLTFRSNKLRDALDERAAQAQAQVEAQ